MSQASPAAQVLSTDDASVVAASRSSRPALHDQIAAALRWRIAHGVYPPGLAIPTWPEIGAEFGVGASTMVRVSKILRAEKLIDGIPMRGTFVRDDLPPLTVPDTEPSVTRSISQPRPAPEPAEDGPAGRAGHRRVATWVQAVIASRIAAGDYRPGRRIPSHRSLSEELGVGRHSMDIAMKALQAAGLLTAEPLKGSYVAADLPADLGPTTAPPRPAGLFSHWQVTLGPFGEDTAAFGAALAARRRAARLTLADAAAQIGIARTTLSELEKGYVRSPSREKIKLTLAWLEGRSAGGAGVVVGGKGRTAAAAASSPEPAAGAAGRRFFLSYTYLDGLGERVYDRTIINLFDPPDRLETLDGVEARLGVRHGVDDEHVKILFLQPLGDR